MNTTPEQLAVLNYFQGVMLQKKSPHDACKVLAEEIIPMIRQVAFDDHSRWMQDKENFLREKNELEDRILSAQQTAFEQIKKQLDTVHLSQEPAIRQAICVIETILDIRKVDAESFIKQSIAPTPTERTVFQEMKSGSYVPVSEIYQKDFVVICRNCNAPEDHHRPTALPSFIWGLHNELQHLCTLVVDIGRKDLGEEHYNNNQLTVAPLFYELQKLDYILFDEQQPQEWVAYESLWRIEWAWNISRDYLRKKNLKYNDPRACMRSANLLGLHSLYTEINALDPNKAESNGSTFFSNRDTINMNLRTALDTIYGTSTTSILNSELMLPHTIELIMQDEIHLCMKVEWTPGIIQIRHMHTFHDNESKHSKNLSYNFMCDLLNNPGQIMAMEPTQAHISNATQYLRNIGIHGIIDTLFIAKKTRYGAILRSKKVSLVGKARITLKKVRNFLEKLDAIECYKCSEFYCRKDYSC